jgi:GTP diphosphokinase / guanosine-3',5'-bis(diphosphate) 3'-diphosphatase
VTRPQPALAAPARPGTAGNLALAPLLRAVAASRPAGPPADTGLIRRAYDVAAYWHRGQKRRSGDPYITHPLEVATILAGLGADDQTLCAALLHDTTDDTPYSPAELTAEFGPRIAALTDAAAALDKIKYDRARPADAERVIAAAMSADSRVVTIKVADRLHNMRTLRYLPRATRERKSRETLEIFAPAAQRLGMDALKSELEDLASATLNPRRHGGNARTASGRMLSATTVLLPPASRGRWQEEWLAELHALDSRRRRARFALQTMRGLPRLAITLRRPAAARS